MDLIKVSDLYFVLFLKSDLPRIEGSMSAFYSTKPSFVFLSFKEHLVGWLVGWLAGWLVGFQCQHCYFLRHTFPSRCYMET